MSGICSQCGLPKNICACGEILKESQKIKIKIVKRRFGKIITTVEGFEGKEETKKLAKELKRKLACGGTVKGSQIELQGNHKNKIKELLKKEGYKEELIEV